MKEKREKGVRWIVSHPARFVELTVRRFSLFLFTGPELWPTQTRSTTLKFLLFCGLGVGAVIGLGYLVATGHPLRWIFLAGVIGPALPYSLTSVDFRYRYPIYPLTVLLSVLVAGVLLRKLTGKHSGNLSEGSTQVGG
jgi:hypothetical protein